MSKPTCIIDGCATGVTARGLCKRHYYRAQRAGDLDSFPKAPPREPVKPSPCIVGDCEAESFARKMCKPHYRRDYYQRNKSHESASNKSYREANPEYMRSRWADYAERRWGAERESRRRELEKQLAASHKECTRCFTNRPKVDFYDDARRRDGLHSWCKACFKDHCASTVDPDRRNELSRLRLASDSEKRERRYAQHRKWSSRKYATDPEFRATARARSRKWAKDNPERVSINARRSANKRRALMAEQSDGPVDYAAILERDGMVCHICGGDIPSLSDLHFDHVFPLSKGGAHSYDNIKPSHASCNMRKGAKILPAA